MSKTNVKQESAEVIREAVEILKSGGLVITPTRTNYNLICDPKNEAAIAKVFEAKKRTKFGPLTLVISYVEQAAAYVKYPDNFEPSVLNQLWPGEVTVIAEKKYPFPSSLTMGAQTLAVCYQGDSTLTRITDAFGAAVACTSANLSGQGDIFVDLDKAVVDIGDKVDLVIDGGEAAAAGARDAQNKSNTIIDLSFGQPYLVRKGVVTVERLLEVIPDLNTDSDAYKELLAARVQK